MLISNQLLNLKINLCRKYYIYLHGIFSFLKCMYLKYELIDCNLF